MYKFSHAVLNYTYNSINMIEKICYCFFVAVVFRIRADRTNDISYVFISDTDAEMAL